jgi:hypothetical protein
MHAVRNFAYSSFCTYNGNGISAGVQRVRNAYWRKNNGYDPIRYRISIIIHRSFDARLYVRIFADDNWHAMHRVHATQRHSDWIDVLGSRHMRYPYTEDGVRVWSVNYVCGLYRRRSTHTFSLTDALKDSCSSWNKLAPRALSYIVVTVDKSSFLQLSWHVHPPWTCSYTEPRGSSARHRKSRTHWDDVIRVNVK